jgi:hypothetical protein
MFCVFRLATLLFSPPQDHRVATSPEAFEAHVEAFVAFLVKLAAEVLRP